MKDGRTSLSSVRSLLVIFFVMQVLDLLTTLAGFKLGAQEMSSFIKSLFPYLGVTGSVVASKLIALALAGIALAFHKIRLLKLANIWYTALVVWNLGILAIAKLSS